MLRWKRRATLIADTQHNVGSVQSSRPTAIEAGGSEEALFADRLRTDPSEGKPGELTWRFLDRVDDPAFDRVRRVLNTWYARYPIDRAQLHGNLIARDNKQFYAAWFELYLLELHRALGFSVVVEPPLPAVAGDPDFLMTGADGSFVVEATIVGGGQDEGRLARIAQIERAVGRIENPNFRLWFHIDSEGDDSPPMKHVRQKVSSWLDSLDWAQERSAIDAGAGEDRPPAMSIGTGDWKFRFQAHARAAKWRGVPSPIIGLGPSDGGVFDHGATLLDRLSDKADQCRGASVPVIVAVRLDGMAVDDEDVRVALMGPSIGRLDMSDPPRVIDTGEHGVGLFRGADGAWRNRHIAAVLAWHTELRPWSITRQAPTLWTHPNPAFDLPRNLPWDRVQFDVEPHRVQGIFDPASVFDLPDGDLFPHASSWPGEPFARNRP